MKKIEMLLLIGTVSSALADTNWVEYPAGKEIWNKLCNASGVEQASADVPFPNYKNEEMLKAALKLSEISNKQSEQSDTFWLYTDIEKVYGLCAGTKKKGGGCPEVKAGSQIIHTNAHNFLTILCAEFRDNVQLLEAKLKWVQNINIVKKEKQTYDKNKGVWEQITGPGYTDLVKFSRSLYDFRENSLGDKGESGKTLDQASVPAVTTCEYRFILKEYLSKGKELGYKIEDFQKYEKALAAFSSGSECSEDEKEHYNEFRGDGNFKPQSLESNAFIWNTRVFSQNCKTPKEAVEGGVLTSKQCEDYFKSPFVSRYNLAKEGVYRMFFYPSDYNEVMKQYREELVLMTEDLNKDGVADMITLDISKVAGEKVFELRENITNLKKEGQHGIANVYAKVMHFATLKATLASGQVDKKYKLVLDQAYKTAEKNILELKTKWQEKIDKENKTEFVQDIETLDYFLNLDNFDGVNIVTQSEIDLNKSLKMLDKGFYNTFSSKEDAWDRIATVLDRHTDWYKIDMLYLGYGFYQPTYSPWVASSYYIHKSDAFTKPGYAMGLSGDGHKHWMFVQKVKNNKWYKASDMNSDWKKNSFDLLNTWFDETTFSRSGLGASEQGWDRFGSATADELDTNIWLYEI